MLKALAALRTWSGSKFEIVVTTTEDRKNLIEQWEIAADNVRTVEQFLKDCYQGEDISKKFPGEQDKVIEAARILRSREMPVGIVAAWDVQVRTMAREINGSKKHNDKYVFITSQEPSERMISEVSIIDILNKLRNYDKIVEQIGPLSLEEKIDWLIKILPPVTKHNEFMKEIERLRLATEAIRESA